MTSSAIEWTDRSDWNPIRGCTRVSPGCGGPGKLGGCYAEQIAARFSGPGQPFEGFAHRVGGEARWTGKVALIEQRLTLPLGWTKPAHIFVNSMFDLFHEALSDEVIDRIFAVMALAPQHTFQVLTKRPERMRAWFARPRQRTPVVECLAELYVEQPELAARWPFDEQRAIAVGLRGWPLPNVWLGTSVEDQERADERIPHLLATPAAVRFLSCEPLLGPLDLTRWTRIAWRCSYCSEFFPAGGYKPSCPSCGRLGGLSGSHPFNRRQNPRSDVGSGIDWAIVGGESGPRARPMHPDWARSLRDQALDAGVPFFFKQWGEWWCQETHPIGSFSRVLKAARIKPSRARPSRGCWDSKGNWRPGDIAGGPPAYTMWRVGKGAAGRQLDGRTWDEFPHAAQPGIRLGAAALAEAGDVR